MHLLSKQGVSIVIIVLLNLIIAACTFPYHIIHDPSYAFMGLTYAYACNRCNRGDHVGGTRRRSTGGEPVILSVLQCTVFAKTLHKHHTCVYMLVL